MRKLLILAALLLCAFPANAQVAQTGAGKATPGGGAASPTTWNPSDKGAGQTLTNGNLTLTGTTVEAVRSINPHTTGKYYFEVTLDAVTGDSQSTGVANSTFVVTTFAGNTNSAAIFYNSGNMLVGNVTALTIPAISVTHIACHAIDLTNGKWWVRDGASGNWNNDVIGNQNPANNTGGVNISSIVSGNMFAAGTSDSSGATTTINFGATAFTGTAPSGFGNW